MAQDEEHAHWIVPTRGAQTLPAIEILTGRGFITGKSGSGKSNSASVIAEELLDNNYNLLIVDPEGEYYGLKEKYEILHVGNDEYCDVSVTPEHAEQLATIALERNMPIILDVSDYLDPAEPKELIAETITQLFQKEKKARKPFLIMIEEMQEYLPQQGGNDELSEVLERVAKRGRKRGLGMLGMSQRPSSVDKDFITQCDWMVWHRLTWQNDIKVVQKVLGTEYADQVEDLDTGEGFLMTDWDEELRKVKFKKKETHDAGATPGLESYERPDLKSVSEELVREIQGEGTSLSSDNTDTGGQASANGSGGASHPQADLDETLEAGLESAAQDSPDSPADQLEDLSAAAGVTESVPENGEEPLDVEPSLDVPAEAVDVEVPASLDEDALVEHVKALKRENYVLEAEIEELRDAIQRGDLGTAEPEPATSRSTASDPETTASQSTGMTVQEIHDAQKPPKPVPPDPPEQRRGVAGNLIELVRMVGYMGRVARYRVKLWNYERRYNV